MIKAIIVRPSDCRVFYRGHRREGDYHLPYATRRKNTYLDKEPPNRRQLIKTWQVLHHYSSHSIPAMNKRWRAANRRFEAHHLGGRGGGRSTCRFLNTYTAHAWL